MFTKLIGAVSSEPCLEMLCSVVKINRQNLIRKADSH